MPDFGQYRVKFAMGVVAAVLRYQINQAAPPIYMTKNTFESFLNFKKPRSLADKAYDLLEEAIVTLQLAPGLIITEQEISDYLDIGRTPTREAILRLSRDRLIQVLPKRGLMIPPLDLVGQLNLLELRRVVEGLICRLAAKRATLSQRQLFSKLSDDFKLSIENKDLINFGRLDKEFGELCLASAQNEYAETAMRPILGLARRSWYYHQQRGASMENMAQLHSNLSAKIASGDAEAADKSLAELLNCVEHFAKKELGIPLNL